MEMRSDTKFKYRSTRIFEKYGYTQIYIVEKNPEPET